MNTASRRFDNRPEYRLIELLQDLRELGVELNEELNFINDDHLQPLGRLLARTIATVTAVHTRTLSSIVADDLAGLVSAVRGIRIPFRDPDLGRTATYDRLRARLGLILLALADGLDAAEALGLTPRTTSLPSKGGTKFPRVDIEDILASILERLAVVEKSLDSLSHVEANPSGFSQQDALLEFYTNSMQAEIDLTKMHVGADKTVVDLDAIARAVETIADLTREFSATVRAWASRVAKQILLIANDLPEQVKGVVREVSAAASRAIQSIRRRRMRKQISTESSQDRNLVRLMEAASPQPALNEHGQLAIGANSVFEQPSEVGELPGLLLRQRNLVRNILHDLPSNSPRHLSTFLRSYDEELLARGNQPILGLLKDDADIINSAVSAPKADDDWLEPGLRRAFTRFQENHELLVQHFPLDAEREALYSRLSIDESKAAGPAFMDVFERVATATQEARKAGLATEEFLNAVGSMTELARVLAALPSSDAATKLVDEPLSAPTSNLPTSAVSVKKRALLNAIGFFERANDLLAASAKGAAQDTMKNALWSAVQALSRFLH